MRLWHHQEQCNSDVALPRAELFGCGTAKNRVIRFMHCQEQSYSVVALPRAEKFGCGMLRAG